jgi:hypothetical protein
MTPDNAFYILKNELYGQSESRDIVSGLPMAVLLVDDFQRVCQASGIDGST